MWVILLYATYSMSWLLGTNLYIEIGKKININNLFIIRIGKTCVYLYNIIMNGQ